MADPKIDDRSDEMEHDLHKLEDHIADAEKQLEARKEAAGVADGPSSGDDDERVDEEMANPT